MGMQHQWGVAVRNKYVVAAEIRYVNTRDLEDEGSSLLLRRGHGQAELTEFFDNLAVVDGEDILVTWGAIWFKDATWACYVQDEWGGYWSHQSVLQIPEYLK